MTLDNLVDTAVCIACQEKGRSSRAFFSSKLERWLCFSFVGCQAPKGVYEVGNEPAVRPRLVRRRKEG